MPLGGEAAGQVAAAVDERHDEDRARDEHVLAALVREGALRHHEQHLPPGFPFLLVDVRDPLEEEESDLSLKKIRQERLKLVEKEFFHDLSGRVTSMVLVSEHSPHEAIYHHVKENPYNLIVMATVGRTGIRYLMMGSTTANLVRHVKTAVLSINPRKQ